MAGKQAKTLSKTQLQATLAFLSERSRNPERDKVMVLLSAKAGLRAVEISRLRWGMVTDSEGQVADAVSLPDAAAKMGSGRTVPMNKELKRELVSLLAKIGPSAPDPVIFSERGGYPERRDDGDLVPMGRQSVVNWFHRLYRAMGYEGCSSHSGRRTFVTQAARAIVSAGGSLRDVQELAGHRQLSTTQLYIDGDAAAKRKVVDLI